MLWAIKELIAAHTPACVIPRITNIKVILWFVLESKYADVPFLHVTAYLAQTQTEVQAMAK